MLAEDTLDPAPTSTSNAPATTQPPAPAATQPPTTPAPPAGNEPTTTVQPPTSPTPAPTQPAEPLVALNVPSAPVAASRFNALVDPNRWEGPARTSGQLIVAGDRFNPGDSTGNMGYGLTFDSNRNVHSFAMADGTTLRWGASKATGIPGNSIVTAVQWKTDDGYDPNAEQGATNPSVQTPPNDPLFFDGTRNQMSFIDTPIRSGANADRVLLGTLFKVPDWAPSAQDNKAVLMNIHAPDVAPLSSPLSTYIDHGRLKVVARTSTSLRPVNNSANNRTVFDAPIPASSIGSWWSIAYEVKLSPNSSDNPFLRVWIRRGQGAAWEQVVDESAPIGYVYDGYASGRTSGAQLNGSNYPVLASYYSWHKWGNDFDTRFPVRRLEFGFAGAIIGDDVSAADLRATLDTYAG